MKVKKIRYIEKARYRWIDVVEMPCHLSPQQFGEQYAKLLEKYAVWKMVVEAGKPTRALVFDK